MNDYLKRHDLSALKAKVAVAASVTVQSCAVSAGAGLLENCNPMRLTRFHGPVDALRHEIPAATASTVRNDRQ